MVPELSCIPSHRLALHSTPASPRWASPRARSRRRRETCLVELHKPLAQPVHFVPIDCDRVSITGRYSHAPGNTRSTALPRVGRSDGATHSWTPGRCRPGPGWSSYPYCAVRRVDMNKAGHVDQKKGPPNCTRRDVKSRRFRRDGGRRWIVRKNVGRAAGEGGAWSRLRAAILLVA